jgi:hypothetical protein
MAGGIFVDKPFYPNIKCIIFSLILMICYYFMGGRNKFIFPLIFIIAYVSMAWYDYMYDCTNQLYSGRFGLNIIDSWPKPQRRNSENKSGVKLLENQELEFKKRIYLFHIIIVSSLLLYLGLKHGSANPHIYPAVIIISISILFYHSLRLKYPRNVTNCPVNEAAAIQESMILTAIYLMHIFIIFPIFLYVGIKGNNSNKKVWPVFTMLGVITLSYHLFRYFSPRIVKQC